MERVRLTLERIRNATCPPGRQQAFLWDTESPRLAVRITAGSKSFVFEGKLNRKTIRRTIGDTRVWKLDAARVEANRLQELIDRGIDPRELDREQEERREAERIALEAAKKEAEDRKRYTLRALCNAYIDFLKTQGKTKSVATARSAFKCHLFEPHPDLANSPAREVSFIQIREVIRQVDEQGKERTAGILRSYLLAAFNTARQAHFSANLPSSFIPFRIEQNPVERVSRIPVKAGQRHLNSEELKGYLGHLGDDLTDQVLKVALYAGGQRMAQLLRAKVSDYDSRAKTLRLLDTKGNRREPRIHVLPLGSVAAGIVADLVKKAKAPEQNQNAKQDVTTEKFQRNDSLLIFVSGRGPVHESTPGKRVSEIANAMGGEPFDLRDIRRTVETMLASLGISRDIRAQLLSHGVTGVQATHYDRHSYLEEKAAALRKWERHLASILGSKQKGKVVPIR